MTLLITFVNDDFVVQMSDERSSRFDTAAQMYRPQDEDVKKQALVKGSMIVSFTGPVTIGRRTDTAVWVGRRLASATGDLTQAVDEIADDLTRIFRRRRYRRHGSTLTIALAGWVMLAGADVLKPVIGEISNMDPADFSMMPRFDRKVFWVDGESLWMTRGQLLTDSDEADLRDQVESAVVRDGGRLQAILVAFVAALRKTSERTDLVGPSAVFGVLPRAAAETGLADPNDYWVGVGTDGVGVDALPMFVRVPADGHHPVPYEPLLFPPAEGKRTIRLVHRSR